MIEKDAPDWGQFLVSSSRYRRKTSPLQGLFEKNGLGSEVIRTETIEPYYSNMTLVNSEFSTSECSQYGR